MAQQPGDQDKTGRRNKSGIRSGDDQLFTCHPPMAGSCPVLEPVGRLNHALRTARNFSQMPFALTRRRSVPRQSQFRQALRGQSRKAELVRLAVPSTIKDCLHRRFQHVLGRADGLIGVLRKGPLIRSLCCVRSMEEICLIASRSSNPRATAPSMGSDRDSITLAMIPFTWAGPRFHSSPGIINRSASSAASNSRPARRASYHVIQACQPSSSGNLSLKSAHRLLAQTGVPPRYSALSLRSVTVSSG